MAVSKYFMFLTEAHKCACALGGNKIVLYVILESLYKMNTMESLCLYFSLMVKNPVSHNMKE
jgi:hypothetical protein